MRRAFTFSMLLGVLVTLAVAAFASAAPTVKFKARAVAIPRPGGGTYPHTGDILGAGAALQAEFTITGSGYGATAQNPAGGVPPLSGVNFYLPAGAKINASRFKTCPLATLSNVGPSGCRRSAVASPKGSALGEVTFGTERVPERASLQAFFAPGGGLLFYVAGSSPVSLEFVSSARYVNSRQPPYGLELQTQVPAIATVPGAPLASTRTIDIKVGAAIRHGRRLISYGTMPNKCSRGGFPVKAELTFGGSFGGEREFGIPAETVTATYKAPCPGRRGGRRR
jgi:hypothetical protein